MTTIRADYPFSPKPAPTRAPVDLPNSLCLADAIEHVGRFLFSNEWSGKEATARILPPLPPGPPAEAHELLSRAGKHTQIYPDAPELGDSTSTTEPLIRKEYETERAANERWQATLRKLGQLLYSYRPQAVALTTGGYECAVPKRVWVAENARVVFSTGKARFVTDDAQLFAKPIEGWIFVRTKELDEALHGPPDFEEIRKSESPDPTEPKNKGGRPPEYDWGACTTEIIRIANTPDGLPDRQADLVNNLLDWFGKTFDHHPAESAVKKHVSKIYGDIGLKK